MKDIVWIVVADSGLARIFTTSKHAHLKPLETLEHIESHMTASELVTDRPGRGYGKMGLSAHGLEPKTSPTRHEQHVFAKQIAVHLEHSFNLGLFTQLHLVAGPQFLGELRKLLAPNVRKVVVSELDKDLTKQSRTEIRSHLPTPLARIMH